MRLLPLTVAILLAVALLASLPLAAAQNATVLSENGSVMLAVDGVPAARLAFSPPPKTLGQGVRLPINLSAEVLAAPVTDATELVVNHEDPTECAPGAKKCSATPQITYQDLGVQTLTLHAIFNVSANLTLPAPTPEAAVQQDGPFLLLTRTFEVFIEPLAQRKPITGGDMTSASPEAKQEYISHLFPDAGLEARQSLLDKARRADEAFRIRKEVSYTEAQTQFRLVLTPKTGRAASGVTIYEEIPKAAATSVRGLRFGGLTFAEYEAAFPSLFPGEGNYVQVLKDDPLLVWHFAQVERPLELTYEIEGRVDESAGSTTLVTVEALTPARRAPAWLIGVVAALLLVPAALLGARQFKRKRRRPTHTEVQMQVHITPQKTGERISVEADKKTFEGRAIQDEHVLKLQFYIKERLSKGHPKHVIKEDVLKVNWPEELVDEIFKRLGV